MSELQHETAIIERIEAGIIEALQGVMPSAFYIAPFPDEPRKFDPARMDAAALVHYSGSRYASGVDGTPVQQRRELQYTIQLYLHSLRDHIGGYRAVENVRKALQNVPIEGSTPIRIVSDALASQSGGQWTWQVDVACTVTAVAAHIARAPIPRVPMQFQETGT